LLFRLPWRNGRIGTSEILATQADVDASHEYIFKHYVERVIS